MNANEAIARLLRESEEHGKMLARIAAHLGIGASAGAQANNGAAPASGQVADDRDLDGDHGDPLTKYGLKEKYWPHQPDEYVGLKFSECPSDYLEAMARYLDACAYVIAKGSADKPADPKKAGYKSRDAARARGWSLRNKGRAPAPAAAPEEVDIPF